MLKSIHPGLTAHAGRAFILAVLGGLSACESSDPADVSFEMPNFDLPTNVVENPSLEASDSELVGWSAYTGEGSGAEATFSVDSTEYRSGMNSFKASITTIGSNPYDIEGGPVMVPVSAGQTYTYIAYAKGSAGARANFTASMNAAPWTVFGEYPLTLDSEWQQVAFQFTIPDDFADTSIRLPIQMNFAENVGAEIFVDDVQLLPSELPEGPMNQATNSGLEDSATDAVGWASNADGGKAAGTTISVTQDEAYAGTNSIVFDIGTIADNVDPWSVEGGPVNVPVIEGETYIFSAWVKSDVEGGKVSMNVQIPGGTYSSYGSQEVTTTTEWQHVVFEAYITPYTEIDGEDAEIGAVRLYSQMGFEENEGKKIYLDDVKLIGPSGNIAYNGNIEESATALPGWGGVVDGRTVTQEDVHSGDNAVAFTFGSIASTANVWDVEGGPAGVPVEEGVDYTYSLWVKGSKAGMRANVNVQLGGSPYHAFATEEVVTTGEWQQVILEAYLAPASEVDNYEGPTTEIRLFLQMGFSENSGETLYIDDIVFFAK